MLSIFPPATQKIKFWFHSDGFLRLQCVSHGDARHRWAQYRFAWEGSHVLTMKDIGGNSGEFNWCVEWQCSICVPSARFVVTVELTSFENLILLTTERRERAHIQLESGHKSLKPPIPFADEPCRCPSLTWKSVRPHTNMQRHTGVKMSFTLTGWSTKYEDRLQVICIHEKYL